MVAALALPSTVQVLDGLRSEAADLARDLAVGTVGMVRSDALDLAEKIEGLGRQVDHLRILAARAVDLAAPRPVATMLVDHQAGTDPGVLDVAAPDSRRDGVGAAAAARHECEPLLTPADDGSSPFARAKDLLRDRLRISRKEAGRRLRLAGLVCERVTVTGEVLPPLRPHVAAAVADLDAEASLEVVRVLERVDALGDVTADQAEEVEATLVDHALTFDPDRLRRIGCHAVAVLDPDGAEPEETLARSRQGVHIGRLYRGLATIKLVVDAVQLEILQTAFDAGTNPRTSTPPLLDAEGRLGADVDPSAPAPSSSEGLGTGAPDAADRADATDGPDAASGGAPGAGFRPAEEPAQRAGDAPYGPVDARTRPQRQLDALVAATAAAIRHGVLPDTGGTPTQLIVTISATDLAADAGTADSGSADAAATTAGPAGPHEAPSSGSPPTTRPTPGLGPPTAPVSSPGVALLPHAGPVPFRMVRHLVCDATITAVVLGNGRRVLEVGRSVRIVPPWMRLAVIARDGTDCAFPGCTVPASWCEAHHILPWRKGGATSVANTVMLCPHHHKLADSGSWTIHQTRPGASPTFLPAR